MSNEIRASSVLTTTKSTAGTPDLTPQNPLFSVGQQDSFPHILKQQVDTRGDQRREPESRHERTAPKNTQPKADHRATDRRADGKRLPERNESTSASHSGRPAKAEKTTARDERTQADEAQTASNATPASEAATPVTAETTVTPQPVTSEAEAQAPVEAALAEETPAEGSVLSELALLQTQTDAAAMTEGAVVTSDPNRVNAEDETKLDAGVRETQHGDNPIADLSLLDPATSGQQAMPAVAVAVDAVEAAMVAEDGAATLTRTVPVAMAVTVDEARQSAATDSDAAPEDSAMLRTAAAELNTATKALAEQDGGNTEADTGDGLENWELGHEPTQAEKNAEHRAEFAKSLAAVSDRNSPLKEQLVALASQLNGESTRKEKADTDKPAVTSDIKATAFGRSLEQLGNTRSEGGKTVSTGIQTPVNSREWAGEMGQRLVMMVSSKLKNAEIHLNPKDLGPVEVRIRMQEDKAHVVFTSHVAQTREALEQAVPRLREMLDQNGVALGNVDVQDHGAHQSHSQEQLADGKRRRDGNDGTDGDNLVVNEVAPRQLLGLVDYYA